MHDELLKIKIALVLLALTLGLATPAAAETISIDPARPTQSWLAASTTAPAPEQPREGLKNLPRGQIGWFDYVFEAKEEGWRKIILTANSSVARIEILLDATASGTSTLRANDWLWVSKGSHRLRIQQNYWTGLPSLSAIKLESPLTPNAAPFQLQDAGTGYVWPLNSCTPIHFLAGGTGRPYTLTLVIQQNGQNLAQTPITIAASTQPESFKLSPPCNEAGDFIAQIHSRSPSMRQPDLTRPYAVFDTRPILTTLSKGPLALEINAAQMQPDFLSDSSQTINAGTALAARETSDRGTTPFVRGNTTTPPSWLAYKINGLKPNQPYLLEATFPDDAPRTQVLALRDSQSKTYPFSLGTETGNIWPLSHTLQSRTGYFWPQSSNARAILYNLHNDQTAALSHLRFYEAHEKQEPAPTPQQDEREVALWSEEGSNFFALVGLNPDQRQLHTALTRYMKLAQNTGANLVIPTVVVYNFQLYPSRYNLTFQETDKDTLTAFLLAGQRANIRIMPELHPRADELLWPAASQDQRSKRLLLSKSGETHYQSPDGKILRPPYFNALSPHVRNWYRDMIGELADRYASYKNFDGIQLRVSGWQNAALNNLVSLDWGYDRATVTRFFKETNHALPDDIENAPNDKTAAARSYTLLTTDLRSPWITWRCQQIRDIMQDIVTRVQKARPDLKVRLHFSALSHNRQPNGEALREMGLDLALLAQIKGLELVDGRFQHGSKESDKFWQKNMRQGPREPHGTALFDQNAASRPLTLHAMHYMEITGKVATAAQLGWPAATKDPWVSAASEPAGRLRLARYAELVAEHDVYMLGDGGNGTVFADEDLAAFFKAYKAIPRQPFERVAGTPDSIALRKRGNMFYIVNMSAAPQTVRLSLPQVSTLTNQATGQTETLKQGTLELSLKPYDLQVFETPMPLQQILIVPN